MAMTIPFKEIGKVGKRLLIQVAGITQNYKEETVVTAIDFDSCPAECIFKRFEVDKKRNVCMNHCPHNQITQTPKVVYMNERHRYHIKTVNGFEDSRVSKYQLLQLMSYHFLGTDSNGFVSYVSTKELAEELSCTVRTIRNNNKRLEELGFISFHNYGKDLFSVKINGYENYHLKKEEGGTGYIQMTQSFLEALFSMDNVNVMRLAIRSLLKFDNEAGDEERCEYSYNDIKRFMPSNINHKKIIDELMAKTTHIFHIETANSGIFLSLKEEFNGKIQKKQKSQQFREVLSNQIEVINETALEEESISLSSAETDNLVELAMEYGIEPVVEALHHYKNYHRHTPEKIKNIGGFIRSVIEKNLLRSIGKMIA